MRQTTGRPSKRCAILSNILLVTTEPAAEADPGCQTGFAGYEGLAGGPGSLSLSLG
jgi:hypothetical protein